MLKHGHVRVLKSVHDQHDLGDDENEDENQPDDWWIAVAPEDQGGVQNGLRIFSGKVAGKPRKPIRGFTLQITWGNVTKI
jgi:hypothetical protein